MKLLKIHARDMTEGMRRIQDEFGDEAMIVSNRQLVDSIEITIGIEDELFMVGSQVMDASSQYLSERSSEVHTKDDVAQTITDLAPLNAKQLHQQFKQHIDSVSNIQQSLHPQYNTQNDDVITQLSSGVLNNVESSDQNPVSLVNHTGEKKGLLEKLTSSIKRKAGHENYAQMIDDLCIDDEPGGLNGAVKRTETIKESIGSGGAIDGVDHRHPLSAENAQRDTASIASSSAQSDYESLRDAFKQIQTQLDEALAAQQRSTEQLTSKLEHSSSPVALGANRLQQVMFERLSKLGFTQNFAWSLCLAYSSGDLSKNFAKAWRDMLNNLAQQLPVLSTQTWAEGEVYLPLGCAGSGRTQVLVNIALQALMQSHKVKLAFISYDHKKIGAYEELLNWGEVLSVPVYQAKDVTHLAALCKKLASEHLVLIDYQAIDPNKALSAELEKLLFSRDKVFAKTLRTHGFSENTTPQHYQSIHRVLSDNYTEQYADIWRHKVRPIWVSSNAQRVELRHQLYRCLGDKAVYAQVLTQVDQFTDLHEWIEHTVREYSVPLLAVSCGGPKPEYLQSLTAFEVLQMQLRQSNTASSSEVNIQPQIRDNEALSPLYAGISQAKSVAGSVNQSFGA